MNRWSGIAAVAVTLGLAVQDALAASTVTPSAGTGSRSSSPGFSGGTNRPSATAGTSSQYRHHRHPHPPPANGIVVVPAFVPWGWWYYPPAVSYGLSSSFYPVMPALSGAAGYQPGASDYWYFCPDSRQYFPYVQDCASGWLTVVPGVAGPPN